MKLKTKHGMCRTRFYKTWQNMKARCNQPNRKDSKSYYDKGIKCLWDKFEDFRDDMYEDYKDNLEIDRINNDGDYEKDNCRWVTRKQQLRNFSRNKFITYKNETKTLIEWSEKLKINYRTLNDRMKRYGWSINEAFNTPVLKTWNPHLKHNEQKHAKKRATIHNQASKVVKI